MENDKNLYYSFIEEYYEKNHIVDFKRNEIVEYKGKKLQIGAWILLKKIEYKRNSLMDKRLSFIFDQDYRLVINDTWSDMYEVLCNFLDIYHHANVPYMYVYCVLDATVNLGAWVIRQRDLYNKGKLSSKKAELLNNLGINWKLRSRNEWDYYYEYARQFYQVHHHLNIRTSYSITVGDKKVNLGMWLNNQKKAYKKGTLSIEQIKALEAIDIYWSEKEEKVKIFPIILKKYFDEHGNINMSESTVVCYNNRTYPIGKWVANLKKLYKNGELKDEAMQKILTDYNIIWDRNEYSWNKMYHLAEIYFRDTGHLDIPRSYSVHEGNQIYHLGKWLATQRYKHNIGELETAKIKMLERIGVKWKVIIDVIDWQDAFFYAKEYFETNHHLNVPANYQVEGFQLGIWIITQKRLWNSNHLSSEKKELLKTIGLSLDVRLSDWDMMMETLRYYMQSFSTLKNLKAFLPANEYERITSFVKKQIKNKPIDSFKKEEKELLKNIGFSLNAISNEWQKKYEVAKSFYDENHHLNVSRYYALMLDEEIFYLSKWLRRQRTLYNQHNLINEKKVLLEDIGIVWNYEDLWNKNYALAMEYYRENGHLKIMYNYVAHAKHGEIKLGKWIITQRTKYKAGMLDTDKIEKLNNIKMVWSCSKDDLREICEEYGINYDRYFRNIRCNSKEVLLAKIIFMQNNNIPFFRASGRINPIFSMCAANFSMKYGISIEELAQEISKKGVVKCL